MTRYKPKIQRCPRCGTNDNGRRFVEPLPGGGHAPCLHPIHEYNDQETLRAVDPDLWSKIKGKLRTKRPSVSTRTGLDPDQKLRLRCVELHADLMRAGLYRTGHAMHEVVRAIGYEVAESVTDRRKR